MKNVNLAIVGSRNFNDYSLVCKAIDQFLNAWIIEKTSIKMVISGGAKGTDTLAEEWATKNNLSMKIFYPNCQKYGKSAGPLRNTQIVNWATHIIAFPSKSGKGTQDTIYKAIKSEKPIKVLWYDSQDPIVDTWLNFLPQDDQINKSDINHN